MTERYEIRLKGHLHTDWSNWLSEPTVTHTAEGETVLYGDVIDQAALHGLLTRVRDLGVPILTIVRHQSEAMRMCAHNPLQKENSIMKNPWIAAILNFFLMGPGTVYNGRRKAVGAALTVGAILLTYVELQLNTAAPALFPIMFGTVFLINSFLAIDGYNEAKAINAS